MTLLEHVAVRDWRLPALCCLDAKFAVVEAYCSHFNSCMGFI